MNKRDDFTEMIRRSLADRAAGRCSNPDCRAPTSGPRVQPHKALNLGVAAHITAAAPRGPRFDETLTEEQRSNIDNGIWLCQNCAKLVDNDPDRFPLTLLRHWKQQAEARALGEIGKSTFDADKGATSTNPVADCWVSLDYATKAGIDVELGKQGYKLRWVRLSRVLEFIDLRGWEEVIYRRPNGDYVRLKVREPSGDHLALLKRLDTQIEQPHTNEPLLSPHALGDLEEILSALRTAHLNVLEKLCYGPAELSAIGDVTKTLVSIGAVERIAPIETFTGLFRLQKNAATQIRAFISARRLERIRACLAGSADEERRVLTLFAEPQPDEGEFVHPFLPWSTYGAVDRLVTEKLLARTEYKRDNHFYERIVVAEEAISLVEKWLGKPLQRHEITLDLTRVAPSGAGGSGAHPQGGRNTSL